MVQIIPAAPVVQDPLIGGLQAGIASLAENLMAKRQQRADVDALQQALGISEEQAQQIMTASPELRQTLLQKALPKPQSTLQQILAGARVETEPTQATMDPLSDPARQDPVPSGFDPAALSRTDLDMLAASQFEEDRRLANAELRQREIETREKKPFVQADIKRSTKFLETVDESRSQVQRKTSALNQMQGALDEQNLGFFSKDNLAKQLGRFGKGLVSPQGALLDNAAKEFLISDLERVKGRPNIFLEQRILSMMAEVGKSQEANQSVTEAMKMHVDIEQALIRKSDEIEQRFRDQGKAVPGNIAALVDKEVAEEVEQIEQQTAFKIREIQERNLSEDELFKSINKKPRKGTPLTPKNARAMFRKFGDAEKVVRHAEKLGYRVPSRDEFERFSQ